MTIFAWFSPNFPFPNTGAAPECLKMLHPSLKKSEPTRTYAYDKDDFENAISNITNHIPSLPQQRPSARCKIVVFITYSHPFRRYCSVLLISTCDTAWWRSAPRRSVWRSTVRRSTCTWSRRFRPRSTACHPAWPRRSCSAGCSLPVRSSTCSSWDRTSPRWTDSWSSRSLPERIGSCLCVMDTRGIKQNR